uniref:Uncharacterized protein n=1 Tax=Leersia perrieri TaxID=77586 RepID=A0A0D9W556_9ORYZ
MVPLQPCVNLLRSSYLRYAARRMKNFEEWRVVSSLSFSFKRSYLQDGGIYKPSLRTKLIITKFLFGYHCQEILSINLLLAMHPAIHLLRGYHVLNLRIIAISLEHRILETQDILIVILLLLLLINV